MHVASEPTGAVPPEADAAVTATRGLPLAILTADCAPVALACDDAIGVVHAGHRGLEHGVIEAAVAALREIGSGPVRLSRAVHPARAPQFRSRRPRPARRPLRSRKSKAAPLRRPPGVRRADRRAYLALEQCAVGAFGDANVCTADSPGHFSYRRDGVSGRQATIAVLP